MAIMAISNKVSSNHHGVIHHESNGVSGVAAAAASSSMAINISKLSSRQLIGLDATHQPRYDIIING